VKPREDITELVEGAVGGTARAVSKLLTIVDDDHPAAAEVAEALTPHARATAVIGITGPPGVGKSTLTSLLVRSIRSRGQRVGVLAVDPSSPFSRGALLGDRVRMMEHAGDSEVFIRSVSARGHLGGLSSSVPQSVRVLEACFDVVIVETVGVGQSEVDIAKLADTTVVVLAPGYGDVVQMAKAGILEVADLFVVNKADRDGVDDLLRDLKRVVSLGRHHRAGPHRAQHVITTVATQRAESSTLLDALDDHAAWLKQHDLLTARRVERAALSLQLITVRRVQAELTALAGGRLLPALAEQIAKGETDPYRAAAHLLNAMSRAMASGDSPCGA
jgi:LAO/AO transport system kinase